MGVVVVRADVSGLQPLILPALPTWAFGPGWYMPRLWR